METQQIQCQHSCKGLCTALEVAARQEKEAILQYAHFRDECTYPDVKLMLNELIIQRQKSIRLLEETKAMLQTKFETLGHVQESFEM